MLLSMPQELCNSCGMCCKLRIVRGGLSFDEVTDIIAGNTDASLDAISFLNCFDPITINEAYNISSGFVEDVFKMYPDKRKHLTFFSCKYYDDVNKVCAIYDNRPVFCINYPVPGDSTIYHYDCGFKETGISNWLEIQNILNRLKSINTDLEGRKQQVVEQYREDYKTYKQYAEKRTKLKDLPQHLCIRCGSCCKVAVNQHSYKHLLELAEQGDKESCDFLSVFEPYDSIDQAKLVDEKYVNYILENLSHRFEEIKFYYCSYVKENNECGNYEERPRVCRETPFSPWMLVPTRCGFTGFLFEKREQTKKYVRNLSEYNYFLEIFLSNGLSVTMPEELLDLIRNIDEEKIEPWGKFTYFPDFEEIISLADDPYSLEIEIDEYRELIKEKLAPWIGICC